MDTKPAPWDSTHGLWSVGFRVDGLPQSKGSFTRMPGGQMLPAGTKASRERKQTWGYDLKMAASHVMDSQAPWEGPIRVTVRFELPYPKSIRNWQQGWWPCMKQPDLDKLVRAVLDAFTGIIWVDDSQVFAVAASKVYAWDGRPGAEFDITQVASTLLRKQAHVASTIKAAMS